MKAPSRRAAWAGSRRKGCIAIACLAIMAATMAPVEAARTATTYRLAPTVGLKTIRVSEGPQEIRVLRLAPGTVPDIQPGGQQFPLRMKTSAMSAEAGALAGINGGFGTDADQPVHLLMIDGELWTTGLLPGRAIAWSSSGGRAFIGRPDLRIKVVAHHDALFDIDSWNALQGATSVSAYTSRGGSLAKPPGVASPSVLDPSWCEARLEPRSGLEWRDATRDTIVRQYEVVEQPQPCPQTPLEVGTTPGAVVLAAGAVVGLPNAVRALSVGDRLRIRWRLAGWPGTVDVIGGAQILVEAGVNVAPGYYNSAPHILDYNPRTAVGITEGCSDTDRHTACSINWITVDGRQASTDWSRGVRLPFLANEFIRWGSWAALNLDGGGSTTMWVRDVDPSYCQIYPVVGGCVVNRPSTGASGGERSIRDALVVLPTADPGTPAGLR
jgi:hypothetical protein